MNELPWRHTTDKSLVRAFLCIRLDIDFLLIQELSFVDATVGFGIHRELNHFRHHTIYAWVFLSEVLHVMKNLQ